MKCKMAADQVLKRFARQIRKEDAFRENGRIDRPEIDVIEKVPGIEAVEGWLFAIEPRLDPTAADEHGSGGTMVGASIGILNYASAELAEGHDEYSIKNVLCFQVPAKSGESSR